MSAPPEPPDPILTRPFVYVEGSRFMFQGEELRFKGVNYFPVKQNWRNMWLNWDAAAIEKEITLLRGLGVTVVRVFIPGRDFKDSENRLKERMISRLDTVLGPLIGRPALVGQLEGLAGLVFGAD